MIRGTATFLVLPLLLFTGCAASAPTLAGGRAAPEGRTEVSLGGATRIPFGELASRKRRRDVEAEAARRSAWVGGAVPVGAARFGLGDGWDAGLVAGGTRARLELRRELVVQEGLTRVVVLLGAGGLLGAANDGDDTPFEPGTGVRFGGELPLLVAADATGLGEAWAGFRLGAEAVRVDVPRPEDSTGPGPLKVPLDGRSFRSELVLGFGWGFRNLHVLFELAAGHEWWWTRLGDRRGAVLTPAFVLRYRL